MKVGSSRAGRGPGGLRVVRSYTEPEREQRGWPRSCPGPRSFPRGAHMRVWLETVRPYGHVCCMCARPVGCCVCARTQGHLQVILRDGVPICVRILLCSYVAGCDCVCTCVRRYKYSDFSIGCKRV